MLFSEKYTVCSENAEAGATLCRYLTALTGRAPGADGFKISLSLLPAAKDAPRDGGDERFSIAVSASGARLQAHGVRGAQFAAYAFLEDFLGCRFLTADAEYLPERPALIMGQRDYAPAFSYREAYWRGALDGDFALKMRLNSARAAIREEQGGRVTFHEYSHTFEKLLPPDEYFDAHPEYFSFFNGARQRENSQLCLMNREVLALCIKKVRAWMRAHPECRIFSVAQNDWYGYCECPACRALDEREGGHSGTMIAFVNAIADAVKDEFPDNFIHTFAYLYTRKAPKTLRPRANVIVRLCSIECCFSHPMATCGSAIADIDVAGGAARAFKAGERLFRDDLAAWGKIAPNLYIWDYTTNFANYLAPFPNLHVMKDNLRLMRDAGVTGVFEQGNYAPGAASALAGLKIYLLSHLMWNPDADDRALIEDFATHYFGPAAPDVLQYIELIEGCVLPEHMGIFDAPDSPAIPDEAVEKGRALLERALAACETEEQARRVRLEKLSPDYLYLTRLPLFAPGRAEMIDAFEKEARALGVRELFERRALKESFLCMKNSRFARDRSAVPYAVYRL